MRQYLTPAAAQPGVRHTAGSPAPALGGAFALAAERQLYACFISFTRLYCMNPLCSPLRTRTGADLGPLFLLALLSWLLTCLPGICCLLSTPLIVFVR